MIRNVLTSAAALFAGSALLAATAQTSEVTITTTDLGDGLYMLEGQGGNIGLSVGADGVFMIDDQFGRIADKIKAAIAEITDQPVDYVLNTHWHGDHTGGNEAFAASGATILAHDNVRKRMKEGMNANGRNTPPAPEGALPVITFSDTTTFHWNGHEIHAYHFANAHTDGDAIIHFRAANVMHLGDTFFSGRYPFIDLASGGSVSGFIANLEAAAALADGDTKVIPGHGPLSSKADIETMISVLKETRAKVKALVDQGMDDAAIVAADPLKDYNETYAWGFINGERFTRTLIADLRG